MYLVFVVEEWLVDDARDGPLADGDADEHRHVVQEPLRVLLRPVQRVNPHRELGAQFKWNISACVLKGRKSNSGQKGQYPYSGTF